MFTIADVDNLLLLLTLLYGHIVRHTCKPSEKEGEEEDCEKERGGNRAARNTVPLLAVYNCSFV